MGAISGDLGANEIIRLLGMKPHPEGGYYAETYRPESDTRPRSTAIYYLLSADEVSAWHRVDADEHWLWHAGGAIALTISPPDGNGATAHTLGPDLRAGLVRVCARSPHFHPVARWSVRSHRRHAITNVRPHRRGAMPTLRRRLRDSRWPWIAGACHSPGGKFQHSNRLLDAVSYPEGE